VGNVPDEAREAIKDGRIDGTGSKVILADFAKQNKDGWQAEYLAKDEAVPIKTFPDSRALVCACGVYRSWSI